jgi:hypothetical protein
MNNFEFLSYEPVSGEKFLGIATIRAWSKIILRYKIVPNKDGSSFFASPSSIKNGDRFEAAFMLDSNYENQGLQAMIREKVGNYLLGKPIEPPMPAGGDPGPKDEDCPF